MDFACGLGQTGLWEVMDRFLTAGSRWSALGEGYADDCDVGKAGKKACKNCTCGRAEMEEQQQQQGEGVKISAGMLTDNPKSACGNVSVEWTP